MADKKISELINATSINSDAVFPLSQQVSGNEATVKGTIDQIGDYVAKEQTHSTLNTISKKLIGAINEIAAGGGGGGGSSHNYSTTEQIVGTWIDGSTLYEKTIPITQGSTETHVSLSDLDIDTFFAVSAFIIHSGNGDTVPLTYYTTGSDKSMLYYNRTNKRLVVQGGTWTGSGYVTIRYTKSSS